jgi:hypothetical protein
MEHSTSRGNRRCDSGIDCADDFHHFSMEWPASAITRFFHHYFVADRSLAWVHLDGWGSTELINNLAVGSFWPGSPRSIADVLAVLAVGSVPTHA